MIGNSGHNGATFGHEAYFNTTSYALLQNSIGETFVNALASKQLHLCTNSQIRAYVDDSSNGSKLNFTGQHRTFIKDVPYNNVSKQGLIVCSNQNNYINMADDIKYGNEGITVNESLPIVSISSKINDKSCFGVISTAEDPDNRIDTYGNIHIPFIKELGDTRFYINSVGEGAVWVSNANGSLESGDYITTSAIPGYGMKQDSEFLANYTVAKITMDCDFAPPLVAQQAIKKVDGVNDLDANGELQWVDAVDEAGAIIMEYKYNIRYVDASGAIIDKATFDSVGGHISAFVGCTYHCG